MLLTPCYRDSRSTHRLVKEVAAYEKEAQEQEAKVRAMKEDGKDPYDIKKQEEVLQESYMMIPDSKARLAAAVEDLKAFLVRPAWQGKGVGPFVWCVSATLSGARGVPVRRRDCFSDCCGSIDAHLLGGRSHEHGRSIHPSIQEEHAEVKEVQAAESFAEASSLVAAEGS